VENVLEGQRVDRKNREEGTADVKTRDDGDFDKTDGAGDNWIDSIILKIDLS
jgi:hypothetical protein